MRNLQLLILIAFIPSAIYSQAINQSASGSSTILSDNLSLGLDIAKENLTFSFQSLANNSDKAQRKMIYGVNAFGKNSSGTSFLFQRGDFQANAGIDVFIGQKIRLDYDDQEVTTLINRIESIQKTLEKYKSEKRGLNSIIAGLNEGDPKKEKLRAKVKKLDKSIERTKIEIGKLQTLIAEIDNNPDNKRKVLTYFIRPTISSSAFKLALDNPDSSGLSKVFENRQWINRSLGIGANYEYGRYQIGVGLDYSWNNNFQLLKKKTYKLTSKQVVGETSLESTDEIVAYNGNYSTYESVNLNIDIVAYYSMNNEDADFLAWNIAYLRSEFSLDDAVMPTFTNLGTGLYFYNSSNKILGGIYAEFTDLTQGLEKRKAEPNLRDLENRITLGIVTRINLRTLAPSKRFTK